MTTIQKTTLFFTILTLSTNWGIAQTHLDTLLLNLENAKTAIENAKANYYLAENYIYVETEKSAEYARAGIKYALEPACECPKAEYSLLNILAWAEAELENWDAAEEAALTILNNTDKYPLEDTRAEALRILGYIHTETLNYKKSLEYYQLSLEDALEQQNVINTGAAYSSIARIYHLQDDFENAKKFYELAMTEQRKEGGHRFFLANVISNYLKLLDDPNQTLALIDTCIAIYKESGTVEYEMESIRDKGTFYLEQGEPLKALSLLKQALAMSKNNALGTTYTEVELALVFYEMGALDSALYYGEGAMKKLVEAEADVPSLNRLAKSLTKIHLKRGNQEAALKYFEQHLGFADSIYSTENQTQAAAFNARFENEAKEKEIIQQQLQIERQQSNQTKILLGGGVLVLLLLTAFQWYSNRQKRKKQEAELALELQKSEAERFKQLDGLKTKFFANISHELRTPLTLIMSPLEDAISKLKNKPLEENLILAHSNSKKLLNLVNEILDLSKLEAGKLELHETAVNLNQLTRRIFYSFQSLAQLRKIDLVFKNGLSEELNVKLDVDKFEKLLNNLISNAIKYSKTGGEVELRVASSGLSVGEGVVLSVRDSGEGIPEEDLPKIFDRYYQSSSGKLMGGTGIGLALSRELAQLFGGDLSVESTLGQGSTFRFQLPIQKLETAISSTKEESTALEQISGAIGKTETSYKPILFGERKPQILIVEDNIEMSNFLQKILSPYYDCQRAFDGKEALEMIDKDSFDLITSDVMMPEMDGFEFRETMNQDLDHSLTPFVMLTARALEADKLKGFQLGVDDYITKPFSSKELLARIDNLLRNKLERDKWQKENAVETADLAMGETVDVQMLKQAEQVVLDNLDLPEFKVADLAKNVGYSQRQLSRIIKKLTGFSPVGFILEIRLQKAYQFLENRQFLTVSEVRYEVGIESASYFTTKFKERFGKSPKELLGT